MSWRLPRCDWEYLAEQYRNVGTLRSRFQCTRMTRYNKWRSMKTLYEPCWRFMNRRYERNLRRIGLDRASRLRMRYWSEHRPIETGYGIHNNDWWHR